MCVCVLPAAQGSCQPNALQHVAVSGSYIVSPAAHPCRDWFIRGHGFIASVCVSCLQLRGLASHVQCSMQQVKALFIKLKAELRDNTMPALARKSAAATAELTGADTTPGAGGDVKSGGAGAAAATNALQKQGAEPNGPAVRGPGASGHHHRHAPVANGKVLTSLPVSLAQLKANIPNGKVVGGTAGPSATGSEAAAGGEDGEESRPVVLLMLAVAAAAEGEVKKLQATLESNGCTIR